MTDYSDTLYDKEDTWANAERKPRPPAPPPEIEAMQQMLSEAFHREMILRAEIVRLRRSIDNNGVRNP